MVQGVPIEQAEKLKLEKGGIYPPLGDTAPISVKEPGNGKTHQIDPVQLNEIIRARTEEIFEMVMRELKRVDCMGLLASGLVLTGGGSLLNGSVMLAEEIFHKPVRSGVPKGLSGLAETVHNPAFATGVGLILYGLKHADETAFNGDDTAVFGRILKLFKGWFEGLIS